eukprot:scaffold109984_cov18-Tisochrysis_lutea.AAC.1
MGDEGDLQSGCLAYQPVTGPRQQTPDAWAHIKKRGPYDTSLCPGNMCIGNTLAGMACAHAFAHQHQIAHRLHAYLWLFKTCVIPAGLYASQIWATAYLTQGNKIDNCIQKWLLRFLKSILGVKSPIPSWSVLCEYGIEPVQFN